MKNPDQLIEQLKSTGNKITKIRSQILEIFINSSVPITAQDLIEAFRVLNIPVNKTTIYRELTFLIKNNIIMEIEFGEGKKRYELSSGEHHHHLICLNCKKIEDVELATDLHKEEQRIEKEKNFKIVNHSLEFFGYCSNCR